MHNFGLLNSSYFLLQPFDLPTATLLLRSVKASHIGKAKSPPKFAGNPGSEAGSHGNPAEPEYQRIWPGKPCLLTAAASQHGTLLLHGSPPKRNHGLGFHTSVQSNTERSQKLSEPQLTEIWLNI